MFKQTMSEILNWNDPPAVDHSPPAITAAAPAVVPSTTDEMDAVKAAQYGDIDRLRTIIEGGHWQLDQLDYQNCSLLHWAALNNRLKVVDYLLSKGANVDVVGGDLQATPLHWAVRRTCTPIMVSLIKHGANIYFEDNEGLAPMHVCAQLGITHLTIYFIALGMPCDHADKFHWTSLHWSAKSCNNLECLRALLKLGADPNKQEAQHGNTALHFAIQCESAAAIRMLLDSGSDMTKANLAGVTPLAMLEQAKPQIRDAVKKRHERTYTSGAYTITQPSQAKADHRNWRYVLFLLTPLLAYTLTGVVLHTGIMPFVAKPVLLAVVFIVVFKAGERMLFDRYQNDFPLAVFLGLMPVTHATGLFSMMPIASPWAKLAFFVLSISVWYNFLRCWLGDPGKVAVRHDTQLIAIKNLVEQTKGSYPEYIRFCYTCLNDRPARSKHCSICGCCIRRMDHHCPFIGNCVGERNHINFFVFLLCMTLICLWAVIEMPYYFTAACAEYDITHPHITLDSLVVRYVTWFQCTPWHAMVFCTAWFAFIWIGCLMLQQLYQISCLAMTTNERMNVHRYTHFHQQKPPTSDSGDGSRYRSPFHWGGMMSNVWHFFEFNRIGSVLRFWRRPSSSTNAREDAENASFAEDSSMRDKVPEVNTRLPHYEQTSTDDDDSVNDDLVKLMGVPPV